MKRDISLKAFLLVLLGLIVIECLILIVFVPLYRHDKERKGQEKYCGVAICTEDKTSCFAFKVDKDEKTKIVWRGRCDNYKD